MVFLARSQSEDFAADSDSNWAGCGRTRKKTGGVALLGSHDIKTWSKPQAVNAKSSGGAEMSGVLGESTVGCGFIIVCSNFGASDKIRVHLDASVAKGMVGRERIGKLRHVEVDVLWIQEQQARAVSH